MRPMFNLAHEPWIPCITADGHVVEYGLLDCLLEASQLREVHDENPLITAAVYRLLLAIVHRVFWGPRGYDDWNALWTARAFSRERLENYFAQWSDRFDLFHPERPFFQMQDDRVEPKSVSGLLVSYNIDLFNHPIEEADVALTPAEAARLLIGSQAFRTAGICHPQKKLFYKDGTCTRGVVFLVEGHNLFETLMLNLIRYPDARRDSLDDLPTWEQEDPFASDPSRPYGLLDALTWQSKRILLFPEADSAGLVVRQMTMGPGLELGPDYKDTMKLYYSRDKKEGLQFLRFYEHRALWRDSSTLFRPKQEESGRLPIALSWLAELTSEEFLASDQTYRLMALGMASDQAKVSFYRHERMPLPMGYLHEMKPVEELEVALELAEAVYRAMRDGLRTTARILLAREADRKGSRQPDPADISRLVDHWGVLPRYWGSLEPVFLEVMQDLPDPARAEMASLRWQETLVQAARATFDQAEALAGTSADALKATVQGRRHLESGLRKVFSPEQEEEKA